MNKQELVKALRTGSVIECDETTQTYTMNGEKLHKASAENAIGDLGKYVESACVIETEGDKTIYSYKFYKAHA